MSKVLIRRGRRTDLLCLLEMGREMHGEGLYAFLPFEYDKCRRFVAENIDDPEGCVLVAEDDERIVGMLIGQLVDYFFCDEKVAHSLILYVSPKRRGSNAANLLVRNFRHWAVEQGARELAIGSSTGISSQRIGRLLGRLGLTQVGVVYKERLI